MWEVLWTEKRTIITHEKNSPEPERAPVKYVSNGSDRMDERMNEHLDLGKFSTQKTSCLNQNINVKYVGNSLDKKGHCLTYMKFFCIN